MAVNASSNWPRNRLLLALPSRNLKRLMPELEQIRCQRAQVLMNADSSLDHVFFPDSGVVSVVAVYADGSIIEMATIGREGCSGVQAILGAKRSSVQLLVQIPGSAAKMSRAAFMRAVQSMPSFRSLMYAYVQAFLEQVMVSVACNGAHSLKQRLARWLLMIRVSRSDSPDALLITPKPARRNAGCPKANHHEYCPRVGTFGFDRGPADGKSRYLIGRASQRHLVNVIGWFARASLFTFPRHTGDIVATRVGNVHYRQQTLN